MNAHAVRAGAKALAGMAAITIALTGSAHAQTGGNLPAKVAELASAAKQEGEVTFYASCPEPIAAAVAKGFEEQFGIHANMLRLVTTELQIRYARELQAGAQSADAIIVSHGDGFAEKLIKDGLMVDPQNAGIPALDAYPTKLFKQGAAIIGAEALGFAYNTDLVQEKDVPKDWPDLADPKWKGKLLVVDPVTSVGNTLPLLMIQEKYGDAAIQGIAANVYRLTPGIVPNFEALAAGEGSIGITSLASLAKPMAAKGAPVAHVTLSFAPLLQHSLGLTAKSPHPKAQALFAWYMMVGEGQKILNDPERWSRASPVTGENMPKEGVEMDNSLLPKADALYKLFGTSKKK